VTAGPDLGPEPAADSNRHDLTVKDSDPDKDAFPDQVPDQVLDQDTNQVLDRDLVIR
jgi:hypothetical protein